MANRKYSTLDSDGKIYDFHAESDEAAILIALNNRVKCLIRVRSFIKSSPIYTLLPWRESGY
jgi:hypothetical protein